MEVNGVRHSGAKHARQTLKAKSRAAVIFKERFLILCFSKEFAAF
jgi:hypothetical protein